MYSGDMKKTASPKTEAASASKGDGYRKSVLRDYFEALLIAALFLGFTNTFLVKTFYIPSESMVGTLLEGDRLFVNRYIYGTAETAAGRQLLPNRDIRRGDVVIFRSPKSPETDLVKRCVGLPGDTIRIADKVLYVNDQRVEDDTYTIHRDPRVYPNRQFVKPQARARDNFGPFLVPDAHYFFLGDNRDESYDSRYWGAVPRHLIKGRAVLIYWSFGGETPDGEWYGSWHKVKQLLRTAAGFIGETRWGRTFQLVR